MLILLGVYTDVDSERMKKMSAWLFDYERDFAVPHNHQLF